MPWVSCVNDQNITNYKSRQFLRNWNGGEFTHWHWHWLLRCNIQPLLWHLQIKSLWHIFVPKDLHYGQMVMKLHNCRPRLFLGIWDGEKWPSGSWVMAFTMLKGPPSWAIPSRWLSAVSPLLTHWRYCGLALTHRSHNSCGCNYYPCFGLNDEFIDLF